MSTPKMSILLAWEFGHMEGDLTTCHILFEVTYPDYLLICFLLNMLKELIFSLKN